MFFILSFASCLRAKIPLLFHFGLALGIFIAAYSLYFTWARFEIPLIFFVAHNGIWWICAHLKRFECATHESRHIRKLWKHKIGKDKTYIKCERELDEREKWGMKYSSGVAQNLCYSHVAYANVVCFCLYLPVILWVLLMTAAQRESKFPVFVLKTNIESKGFDAPQANIKFAWVVIASSSKWFSS